MNAPTLRFKNDVNSIFPPWEEHKLFEIANFRRGSFPQPYGLPEWYDDKNGQPFVQVFDVDSNMKLKINTKSRISKLAEKHSVFVQAGTVIITLQGSIGRVALTQYDAFVDRTLLIFESYKKTINPIFFSYLIFLLFEIEKTKAPGGTIKTITKEVLSNFTINIPSLEEQNKIANFLRVIDEKISQLTKKHELLNQYKKGFMQKIFSQELRFKDDDGSEFSDWEEVELGSICKPQQWKTISAEEFTVDGFPVYGANGRIGYFSEYNHENETVAVTCRGATCGEVSLIPPKSYITGNSMSLDEIDVSKINHRFVYYALCYRGFRDVISGSAQPQIVGVAIKKANFDIPKLKEQNKIVEFLCAIDEKISKAQSQLDLVKQYKQGLLQQMFV
jgi:type I restriction enzyme S subunit